METVAVVGVGLIGASFGLALRRAGFSGRIIGVSSPDAIKAGLASGAISEAVTLEQAAQTADLLYLAQPIDRILQTIELLGPMAKPDCLITDAGSTKAAIVEKAMTYLPPGVFLGGHPMAGKEQRGAEAADGALFRGRPYVLTPTGDMLPKMAEFRGWLERCEARVVQMYPAEHDYVVAFTSHLPQLLSSAISVTLAGQRNIEIQDVFGPGLLDMTRLAMSSPEIWNSVIQTNKDNVLKALDQLSDELESIAASVRNGRDVTDLFLAAQRFALQLRRQS